MKIRSGFVSNSSSSSFVLMGFEYSEKDLLKKIGYVSEDEDDWDDKFQAIEEYLRKLSKKYRDISILRSGECGLKTDVIGIMINTDLEESSTVISSVTAFTENVNNIMTEFGVEKEIKIYSGSRYC